MAQSLYVLLLNNMLGVAAAPVNDPIGVGITSGRRIADWTAPKRIADFTAARNIADFTGEEAT